MLVGHDSTIGEDQSVAVDACTLSLAKLAGHLGERVRAVVVTGAAERGETAEKSQRCSVGKSQVMFRYLWNDWKAAWRR